MLVGIHKEDFRYSNRYLRDACPRRMVTPLGEIEESGIVDTDETEAFPPKRSWAGWLSIPVISRS